MDCYCIIQLPLPPPLKGTVTENSEQSSDQQEYYNVNVTNDEVTTEETQAYEDIDNPDRLQNEIEMIPNVTYGVRA